MNNKEQKAYNKGRAEAERLAKKREKVLQDRIDRLTRRLIRISRIAEPRI